MQFQVSLQFYGQQVVSSDHAEILHYSVQVMQAPGRGWGGPMLATSLDATRVRTLRAAYHSFIARQQARGGTVGEWVAQPLRQIGTDLFNALPESVQGRLQRAQAYAVGHGGQLQISLTFDQSAVALLDLPWELLHEPNGRFFYSLRGGGISRCVLLPTAPTANNTNIPASVLGCWAEPQGVDSLTERQRYAPSPSQPQGITWIQGADSLGQLQQALASGAYDGLHVVAHGRVGSAWDFTLALEDENGRCHWFSPGQLAVLLSQYPTIRFVYLDVCAAGKNLIQSNLELDTTLSETSPSGAAGQLLGVGVTAVIIMQDRISQRAAGQIAASFYGEIAHGSSLETAMTTARRAVQLQQDDVLHWSVPALYTQRPTPQTNSRLADWVLDEVATPVVLGPLLIGMVLVILIGYLSFQLAQMTVTEPGMWRRLSALLTACSFIPLLAAVATRKGQAQLAEKYGYNGRSWLPFLWHKYFSAFVWAMMGWVLVWLIWLGVLLTGFQPGPTVRQMMWAGGLIIVAIAAHVGARQAVRQDLLFRRIGFVLFRGGVVDAVVIVMLLLIGPFLPLLFVWSIWLIWTTVRGG